MSRSKTLLVLAVAALVLLTAASLASAGHLLMASAGYQLNGSAITAGSGQMGSAGYRMRGSLGLNASGHAASGSYGQDSGFWLPVYAPAVGISKGDNLGIALNWATEPADVGGYQVWWSTAPYFNPGDPGAAFIQVPPSTTGLSRPNSGGVSYYYLVQGLNGVGQPSPRSNRTGQCLFTLTPGSP